MIFASFDPLIANDLTLIKTSAEFYWFRVGGAINGDQTGGPEGDWLRTEQPMIAVLANH